MSIEAIARFRAAFERLKAGKPERTKPSGNITLNKINNEAGFQRSYIHNKAFSDLKTELLLDIEELKAKGARLENRDYLSEAEEKNKSLRERLKTETRVKEQYRDEIAEKAAIQEAALAKNAILAHHIIDLEAKMRRINDDKVTSINRD